MRPVMLIDDGWLVGGFRHFLLSISYMGCHSSHWRTPSFFKMVIAQPTSWLIWLWFMLFLLQGQDGNLCRGCRLAPLCRCAGKGSSWDTCHSYWMKQLFVACICLSFCRGTPVFGTYVFFWDRSPTYEWLLNSLKSQRRESSRRVE